ncbi:hypothetical protein JCM10049v2_002174 [Rhodotorula toruloides]
MPVGHKRFNGKRANPNDNITFIRVMEGLSDSDTALKILEALAAQFKPIMKEWGFGVNSLVEHEWNPTFAGRNWNAGEVIEIVLRRRDGSFAPYQFLLYVMCHELAHIREMNHSWSFQKVNKQIRAAVSQLRAQKYYGDGFWSSGRSLVYPDAETPFAAEDEPTFACGGANKRSPRRRRRAVQAGPSRARGSAVKLGTTGRQTAIPAKPGGRVKRKGAFEGEGQVLSEDPEMSSFRRRAQAKGAVEARAAAAEARLAAEKRAKAAEARARGAPMPDSPDKKKLKVKDEEEDEWEDAGGFEPEGEGEEWETELDANEVKLEEDEKRFLEEDMRSWRETFADDDEDVKPDVQPDINGASSSKGKSKASTSSTGTKRKASSPTPRAKEPSSKARATDLDLPDDLTPEERAWIEADIKGAHDVEEGAGKKVRVAYMPMPEWMGGEKKGKGKHATSAVSISGSSDEGDSSSTPATSRASSKSKGKTRAVTPPTDDDDDEDDATPACSPSKRKNRNSSEELESPTRKKPTPSSASTSAHRSPMKFFSDSSAAKKHLRALSRSPPPASISTSTAKAKPKTVRPPSDDDDDEAEAPKKKPRKTRSDKGVKRGPRKKRVSTDEEGEKEVKKRGRPRKEPETYAAKAKAALKAKEKEKHRELLEEIEEEEEAEKRERQGMVEPVAKAEKGKGKAADLVVVGLGLHAKRASLSPPPAKKSKLAARPVAATNPDSTDWLPRLSTDNYFDLSSDEREAFLDLLDKEDNVADLSTCEICEVGLREECEGWR